MRSWIAVLVLVGACDADDPVRHLDAAVDACVPEAPVLEVTAPASYACHDKFMTKATLTNRSCEPLTVSAVKLSAVVTAGPCGAPGPGTFAGKTIGPGETATVLDLDGDAFCCTPGACPAQYQCDEQYTLEVTTPSGTLMDVKTVHLSLDGCNEVCP
jgi:hypothetical protein